MTNAERRAALAEARTNALQWVREAEQAYREGSTGTGFAYKTMLADSWANVANAMRKEDGEHDGY